MSVTQAATRRSRGGHRRPAGPGSSLPPIDSGWISSRGLPAAIDWADLEHVGAEDGVAVRDQVVGVVLHERHATRQPGAHHLHRADHRRGLPVPLGAEAVAVAHQPLDGQTGQLREAVKILERVGEGREPAVREEAAQAELDPGPVAQRIVRAVAAGTELMRRRRTRRGTPRSARRPRRRSRLTRRPTRSPTPIAVDAEAEPALSLDLVALGDRDLAHVVAEARDPAGLPVAPRARRSGPARRSRSWTRASLQWPTTTLRSSRIRAAMNPNSRSPCAAWLRFMKSMSIAAQGISRLILGVEVEQRPAGAPRGRRSTSWPARTCASR